VLDSSGLDRRDALSSALHEEYLATSLASLPQLRAAWRERIEIAVERAYRTGEDREAPEFVARIEAAERTYRWVTAVLDLACLPGTGIGSAMTLREVLKSLAERTDATGADRCAEMRAALNLLVSWEATYRLLAEDPGGGAD
jgi:hypothetical protein